ncbi:MAG: hypothetical protein INQ03_19390 [Candidatus Heimdallarchaeota archaeon]|nr:hypothetical protein [Candidatus Heimdallarchaeota archaeon]
MAISSYLIVKYIHLLSIITWFSPLIIVIIINRVIQSLKDEDSQRQVVKILSANAKIASISGSLAVITGVYLSMSFDHSEIWLIMKETIWLLLLIASFTVIRPVSKKIASFSESEGSIDNLIPEIETLQKREMVLAAFLCINIFLVIFKPF